MVDFILHIGLHKTATTTLQRALFYHHSQVYYLGRHRDYSGHRESRNMALYKRFIQPVLMEPESILSTDTINQALIELIDKELNQQKVIIGSWEHLASMNPDMFRQMLRNLMMVLDGNVKLMLTIRHPLSWIPSKYLHELKQIFLKRARHRSRNTFIELEDWLGIHHEHERLSRKFFFVDNIKQAVDIIGEDGIGVFVYEELLQKPHQFYGKICTYSNISYSECMRLVSRKCLNTRLTQSMLSVIQKTQASPINRLLWKFRSSASCRKQLARAATVDTDPAIISLTDIHKQAIITASRPAFDYLNQTFRLGLEQYDYPLSNSALK